MSGGIPRAIKAIPQPKGWPLIGTLGELIAAGGAAKLHEYVHKRHQQLGPIYKEKIGPVTGVFVSSPEYMRHVFAVEGKYPEHIIPEAWALYNSIYGQKRGLLFMEGEEWYANRKLLNNIILRPESSSLLNAVQIPADDLLTLWRNDLRPKHIEQHLYTWSLQNMVAILLGAESYKKHKSSITPQLQNLSVHLKGIFVESAALSLLPAQLARKWNLPPWKRFVTTVNDAFIIANNLMDKLKNIELDKDGILYKLKASEMNEADLNRIVIDMILAAGDTTAYTTQWLLYSLGRHSDIQERLHDEVTRLDLKEAADNQLLRGAVRETLRMYPVAPFITRYMPAHIEIDGYSVNKGELIIMSLYSSGRDERSFPKANEYQPDRWIRVGNSYKNVTNAQGSIPFAMGARSCIGRKIAEIQIAVTLVKVLSGYHIHLNMSDTVEIKLNLIAVPSKPILLNLQPRRFK